jgi:hypothetical protein
VVRRAPQLNVTNGDALVPEIGDDVLVWRDVLCDGPVPDGLGADELALTRARFLASRGWAGEAEALAGLRARDARLAAHEGEIVLWFEDDLFDDCQLAQISDRLVGHEAPVWRVHVPHPPPRERDLHALPREPFEPSREPFAALRSGRGWDVHFPRLLEELPGDDGLGRLEREILAALGDGPLEPYALFVAVSAQEQPPWLGDSSLFAAADALAPLVERRGDTYARTGISEATLPERWVGGVRLPARRARPAQAT